MLKIAQGLWRHKVGVVAVAAIAVFVFSGKKEGASESANPWAKQQAAAPAAPQEPGFTGKLGDMAVDAGNYVVEAALGDKAVDSVKLGGDPSAQLDEAASALKAANN